MSIQPRAQATPVFPPEHRVAQAVFAAPDSAVPGGPLVTPWYRTTVARVDLRLARTLVDAMPGTIVPWYRAAN